MNYYRISKYNSEYRKNNIYTIDEWTAYSDIGKIYNGKEFDYPEYMKIESNYIEMLVHIFKLLKIDKLKILCLEKYEENLDWQDNEILNNEKAITVSNFILFTFTYILSEDFVVFDKYIVYYNGFFVNTSQQIKRINVGLFK